MGLNVFDNRGIAPEEQLRGWAELGLLQADRSVATTAGQVVEELVATVKGWFAGAPTA